MPFPKSARLLSAAIVVTVLGTAVFFTGGEWLPLLRPPAPGSTTADSVPQDDASNNVLKISLQARKNLGLVSRAVRLQDYSRNIQIPGVIVDQPGRSDRGITAPVVGVVTEIHAFPGDTVSPGDRLFTLRLYSEYLQNAQEELFAAEEETQLVDETLKRLRPLAKSGGIARSRIIDLENQLRRQAIVIRAHRRLLLDRGFRVVQIDGVTRGEFVSAIDVLAPPPASTPEVPTLKKAATCAPMEEASVKLLYEVQELAVELGHHVRAGQLLSTLANHTSLYIVGHAFKREAPALETVAQNGRDITVEFAEDDPQHWPVLEQSFRIRHLGNSINTASRTFDCFIPLRNQSRTYEQDDQSFIVWRFRPGQRVRLHVPVEELKDVLVLPAAAVVREGPEAYVFRQNGDLFNRIAVQVLHEDRLNIVLANDGSVTPGLYLAQNAAASLNRVLKSQSASGKRADVHVHADGTVHSSN